METPGRRAVSMSVTPSIRQKGALKRIMSKLPLGKIDPDILGRFLSDYTQKANRVVIGAGIGEDATIIDMGGIYLVAKTDPITHVTGEIGHYAVNINANDIAAMGGRPLWFLATILLPAGAGAGEIEHIFSQLAESCKALGITYCGGHTEVTTSVNNPVVIGQMLGEVTEENLKPTSGARPGDHLIMTKSAAIEATAIMALEKGEALRARFPEGIIKTARNYLHSPGISVVREAGVVARFKEVHALHDPTEGGIATGVFEMATASHLGVVLRYEDIPITEETRLLCDFFGVDPLGAFASGSLLIAASPAVSQGVIDALRAEGITANRVGAMVARERGMTLMKGGEPGPLPVYHQDELSRIFA